MAFKCLSIALDDLENDFLVRSDPGKGLGLSKNCKRLLSNVSQ